MRLTDKVALVTGASSGIGAAVVRRFHEEGALVVAAARSERSLQEVVRPLGERALAVPCDVRSIRHLEQLVRCGSERFGPLDIVVACAGILSVVPVEQVDEAVFDNIVDTNFKGAYFTARLAVPSMRDGGAILFVSSLSAHMGLPGNSVYGASKAALRAAARAISADLRSRGIRANVVTPGPVDTPLFDKREASGDVVAATKKDIAERTPVRRLATAEEIASAAVFLCSEDASYIVGEELVVDGGWRNVYEWR
ncbi:MAG: SDR family oxidoreductase [Acidobacteriota bacterium]|nr:MAG: SDR family oxidoreductase [Acidobacteriota bacterium]